MQKIKITQILIILCSCLILQSCGEQESKSKIETKQPVREDKSALRLILKHDFDYYKNRPASLVINELQEKYGRQVVKNYLTDNINKFEGLDIIKEWITAGNLVYKVSDTNYLNIQININMDSVKYLPENLVDIPFEEWFWGDAVPLDVFGKELVDTILFKFITKENYDRSLKNAIEICGEETLKKYHQGFE